MALEELSPQYLRVAKDTINESDEKMMDSILLIKDWIKYQSHLPYNSFDERLLRTFIRGCRYNVERAKSKLDTYFTCRTVYPELFGNRDSCSFAVEQTLNYFHVIPLPKLTTSGLRIVLHKFVSSDSGQFDVKELLRVIFMIADIRMVEEHFISGDVFLFDLANMSGGHLAKLSATTLIKKSLHSTGHGYPQRLKGIHLFNAPSIVDKVVSLFKQFLKEKIRNRIYVHSKLEDLLDRIPKTHLPKDYGGDLDTSVELQSAWVKKLQSYKSYFERQNNIKSDESKRITDNRSSKVDEFGFNGSFRKLNID